MSIWPYPLLYLKKKQPKNGTFAKKINGATGLKIGMHIQRDSGSTMGWVPPGHTSSSVCKAQNSKNGTSKKNLVLGSYTHKPTQIYIYIYICTSAKQTLETTYLNFVCSHSLSLVVKWSGPSNLDNFITTLGITA